MSMVSNTGPLIALSKGDQLNLLERLFGQVHIPPAGHCELLAKTGPEASRLDHAFAAFVQVAGHPRSTPDVETATLRLDPGEQEAIGLAQEMSLLLRMDDRSGRQAARCLPCGW